MVNRSQRKNTGTVKPKRAMVAKKMVAVHAQINVHQVMWTKKKSKGKLAEESIKKNRVTRAESLQWAFSLKPAIITS
jgi:hypothetical protein